MRELIPVVKTNNFIYSSRPDTFYRAENLNLIIR
jgi:hypothetical protein